MPLCFKYRHSVGDEWIDQHSHILNASVVPIVVDTCRLGVLPLTYVTHGV